MSKTEAIELAKNGQCITHTLFHFKEFLKYEVVSMKWVDQNSRKYDTLSDALGVDEHGPEWVNNWLLKTF